MSLLNDALRKKRTEDRGVSAIVAPLQIARNRVRRKRPSLGMVIWSAVAVLVLAGGGLIGYRWFADEPTPRHFASPAMAGVTEPPVRPQETIQSAPTAPKTVTQADGDPSSPANMSLPVAEPKPSAEVKSPPPSLASISTEPLPLENRSPEPRTPEPRTIDRPERPRPSRPSEAFADDNIDGPPQPRSPGQPVSQTAVQRQPLPERPISSQALFEKARLYHRQARLAEAITLYRETLKRDPNHLQACLQLTSAYLQTQAYTQAYALAADQYRKTPEHPQVVVNLAIAQIGCGRDAQALELLERAAILPGAPLFEVYVHRGVAQRRLGQTAAAIESYQNAERLKPDAPNLLFNLAVAFDQNQAYDQAALYYTKYLRTADDLAPAAQKQIQQRIRTLQAALDAPEGK